MANEEAKEILLKRILVPTDFSDSSKKSIDYAAALAAKFASDVILLHVAEINYTSVEGFAGIDFGALTGDIQKQAERQLQQLREDTALKDIPGESLVILGHSVHQIVETAKELNIDLIVLSTHGHTGIKHLILGSTAENVVRLAPCPVLTVREHEHEFIAGEQD